MRKALTGSAFRKFIAEQDESDMLRIQYCYQIGSTFVVLGLMESTVIDAMGVCDRIKVANVLGSDASKWEKLLDKRSKLQSSTLGSLVKILSQHDIKEADLRYLRWLKEKIDFFVHRLFRRGEWPGDLAADECKAMIRRLAYLEVIFHRATARIWGILVRAGLIDMVDLSPGGLL